jgi:hypothetical protein
MKRLFKILTAQTIATVILSSLAQAGEKFVHCTVADFLSGKIIVSVDLEKFGATQPPYWGHWQNILEREDGLAISFAAPTNDDLSKSVITIQKSTRFGGVFYSYNFAGNLNRTPLEVIIPEYNGFVVICSKINR